MEGGEEGLTSPAFPSDEKTNGEQEWIADWLDELCPYYMNIGVRCNDFWYGDYTKLKHYISAHDLYIEQRNQELYLQGLYNYQAFVAVVGNLFKKSGEPDLHYPTEPFPLTEAQQKARELEDAKKASENFRALAEAKNYERSQKKFLDNQENE